MEKVTKEIKKETVNYIDCYIAVDGTSFTDEEECRKYETSAAVVLLGKIKEFAINKEAVNEIDENDENMYFTVMPVKAEHIDMLNQLKVIMDTRYGNMERPPMFGMFDLNLPILVGYRVDRDSLEWVWFYKLDGFINTVTNGYFTLTERKQTGESSNIATENKAM